MVSHGGCLRFMVFVDPVLHYVTSSDEFQVAYLLMSSADAMKYIHVVSFLTAASSSTISLIVMTLLLISLARET